ncbi:FAD-binding protein [Nocardia sp. NPDC051832]|uniref:FAD-binding oxidoreductase n=1 Tax=Nocardia sp. NPDC051832 TaxID=3155673 RepID=UPI00342FBC6B
MPLSRRRFIGAAGLGGGGLLAGAQAGAAPGTRSPVTGPAVVGPDDPEYQALTLRGYNRRFVARPAKIFLPASAAETCAAVGQAVAGGLRIAARSGGHCFDGFVDDPRTQAIIDLSRMNKVYFDQAHQAYSVDAGTEIGPMYEQLLHGWGVTIPAGICLGVGAGGYLSGGGYGPLSRRLGLAADHVFGVEVVTVDAAGKPAVVVSTRDSDPDLWWAHTGGGGGNFGVVTRFLLRSQDAEGPRLLPEPPAHMLHTRLVVPFASEASFVRLIGNYLSFFERNSAPDNRFAGLYAPLHVKPIAGSCDILVLLDADAPDARACYDEFTAAVSEGVQPPPIGPPLDRKSYSDIVSQVYYAKGTVPPRVKVKAAYLREAYTPDQLRKIYRHMTDARAIGESQLEFLPFGGAINARPADATALPVRDSFMTMLIHAAWRTPGDDEKYLAWAREMYRDIYAETGGVPVPGGAAGGSYINYPDPDLRDPRWNTSGVPWHAFYYRDNYPRLQRIKAKWDPRNTFRHPLSIEPART